MKRILFFILLVISFAADAQVKQQMGTYGIRSRRIQPDSAFRIPTVQVGIKDAYAGFDTAQIYYRKSDSSLLTYTGSQWILARGAAGTTYTAGDGLLLTGSEFKVLTKRSITIDNDSLMLVNDSTASPALYSYRINAAGRKGWYPDNTLIGVTPTWQQTLTAGSTLTGNNTVALGSTTFTMGSGSSYDQLALGATNPYWQQFITKNSRYIQLDATTDGANVSEFAISARGPTSSDISVYSFDQDGFYGQMTKSGVYSSFQFDPDSLFIQPHLGTLNIDTLRVWSGVGDTTYKKPMTWDTRNGRWEYAANWYGGGGGATPTLQQVLTAGSTLTTNNTINNAAYQQEWQWNTLASGTGLLLSSSSTAAASNTQNLFSAQLSGANATASQETFAGSFLNAHTGTTGTNIGVYSYATGGTTNVAGRFIADGGTNNYAIIVPSSKGSVGIGTSAPSEILHVDGVTQMGTAGATLGQLKISGNTSGTVTIQPSAAAGTYTLTLPTNDGDASQFLQTNGSGVLSWVTSSGSPAGNNRNIQFNDLGAFAGNDSLKWAAGEVNILGGLEVGTATQGIIWDNTSQFKITGTSNSGFKITQAAQTWLFYMGAGGTGGFGIYDFDQAADRMVIDASGNTGINTASPTTKLHVVGRMASTQGADVASAAGAIALGTDGNTFEITGTSAITLISNSGWINGSVIHLIFTSTATLTDGTANSGTDIGMELAGNANFTASADDVVTLVLSEVGGTQRWREVSRKLATPIPSIGNQGEILQVSNGAAAWKYDTTTLVTFSAGARFQADTALFTDSTLYGSFYLDGNDTLVITGLKAVMNGGASDTLGIQVTYNDTINVIGTSMFTATLPINSTTVGTSPDADDWTGGAAPFKIPPGNWVWMKTPTVVAGRKPYYLSVSIIGYKKRVN